MNKAAFLTIIALCLSATCYAKSWPEIAPVSGEIVFTDVDNATLGINITDIQNKQIYTLTCKSGETPLDNDFTFSGLFHCRLLSLYSSEYVSSLLVENFHQTADWEGRARFMLDQVVGECAVIPDWGAERTFLLRRMRIILGVHNVELGGNLQHPEVKSFKFTYSMIPDNNAVSSIARKSKISEPWWFGPGGNCIKEVFEKK